MFSGFKIKGITTKVFLITFIMFMIFFIIVMSVQIFIAGYNLIEQKENGLNDKLTKAERNLTEYIEENPMEINNYNYDIKAILSQLRRYLSDDDMVYEFIITDKDGNVSCALKNEIIISYPYDDVYKFAELDNVPEEELFRIVNLLSERVDPLSKLPDISVLGNKIEESLFDYDYYAADTYAFIVYEKIQNPENTLVYMDLTDKLKRDEADTPLPGFNGKYSGNFIAGRNNTLMYFSNVNENRRELLKAVSEGDYKGDSENKKLRETVFYRETDLNSSYNLIMRAQVKPLQVIFESNKSSYLLLSLLMLFFTLIISFIFSKMIVKPVRRIEDKARRLSELDFSSKGDFEYNRGDEIGSLYKSINSLAINLDNAISELRDKNKELTMDIEKEKELEAKRREFIASSSHELKTPLARIRGYAEALDLNLSEDKKEFYCKSLMNEVDIMNELILEMISLSKLEAEKYDDLNISKIDLVKITNKVVGRNIKLITDKSIELSVSVRLKSVKCSGDAAKIERVITNFVDNAIHYTPEGKKIHVILKELKNKARFEIENEGDSIDEEYMPYIWDSFYRVEKARTKDRKSVTAERTGLGLSIVKAILELHRGEYGVKNTKTGVIFYFELDK